MGKLSKAITEWIVAEYLFRYGPSAYSLATSKQKCDAEDALRLALTGCKDPRAAAKAVGLSVEEFEQQNAQSWKDQDGFLAKTMKVKTDKGHLKLRSVTKKKNTTKGSGLFF